MKAFTHSPFFKTARLTLAASAAWTAISLAQGSPEQKPTENPDITKDKRLYVVGYAHLDTQWGWDYPTTIDQYIKNTLVDNFSLFEKYPYYTFTFTGATRFAMMKEYYPDYYEKVKGYIASGRWHIGGSAVDENDVNIPSPESEIRQILYGNRYFEKEFGKTSIDCMLPDCFGFQGFLPTVWAHCGIKGFSTQKLTWGSAVGIPFNIGQWIGPDGASLICAFNPGAYNGGRVLRFPPGRGLSASITIVSGAKEANRCDSKQLSSRGRPLPGSPPTGIHPRGMTPIASAICSNFRFP